MMYCGSKYSERHATGNEDNALTSSTDESESFMSTEREVEIEVETDLWIPLIDKARERSKLDFDEMKKNLFEQGYR